MTSNALSLRKRILITQLLGVFFAFIAEIHTRLLITFGWLFTSYALYYAEVSILLVIFTVLIFLYLDGKRINVMLITIPYIFYRLIILIVGFVIYPTHTEPDDYGTGILALFSSICQLISVVVASILGTYMKYRKVLM